AATNRAGAKAPARLTSNTGWTFARLASRAPERLGVRPPRAPDPGAPRGPEPHDDRRHDEDARERAHDDAYEQDHAEALKHGATQEQEGQDRQQRRARSGDGARQGLVDGEIHDLWQAQLPLRLEVLADPVGHDDGVVERVTDDEQQRRQD